jgi:uncharacterized protein YciI
MNDKLFLFRLLPPRADFAHTLTPEEQDAMARHEAYWQELRSAGRVVVFGPVADPEGVWGLGVVRARSQEEVIALADKDPVIAAGIATFDVMEIIGGLTG